MSCNCKVNQQILKINKQYGHKTNIPFKDKFLFKTEEGFKTILLYLMVLIFFPLIFMFFIFLIRKRKNRVLKQTDFLNFFINKKEK